MKREEFLKRAKNLFGDKVIIEQLKISDEDAERLRVSVEDVRAYPAQAWLVGNRCPHCDWLLAGLFGSFVWGIQHGIGYCATCEQVQFRYYHYVTDRDKAEHGQCRRIVRLAVCGFSEELSNEESDV